MKVFRRSSFVQPHLHTPDYVFIGLAVAMVVVGLLFLSSASSVLGFQRFSDSYYFIKRQVLYGVLPGALLFVIFSRLNYQLLKRLAVPALAASVLLLVLVLIPGIGAEDMAARRWLEIFGFRFQPSELVKLGLLIYLAAWLDKKGPEAMTLRAGLVPFALIVGLLGGLIVIEPDLGTASVVLVSAFGMYFVAGAKLRYLMSLVVLGAGAVWLAVKLEPYRLRRLAVFINPELDPQGIGYHLSQSLLAVGSGGWFGLGLGYSRQKHLYLPEVTGDSVFAIIAEEMGFVFTTMFLVLITAFLVRGFRIVRYASDDFGKYLGAGIMVWLAWQTCINIASMLAIVPLTGVPLPFVSYGGTALTTALAAVGILVSISRSAKLPKRL